MINLNQKSNKKLVYYTHTYFLDCDLPLIKALRNKGIDIYVFVEIVPNMLKSTLIEINSQVTEDSILDYTYYKEFHRFNEYIDLKKLFFINRTSKVYSLNNLKLRISFLNKIRDINPDNLFVTDFLDMFDTLLYFFRKKTTQVVHDPFPHIGENNLRRAFFRKIGLNIIQKFVLLNSIQKEAFKSAYYIKESQIIVASLGTYDCINLFEKKNIKNISFKDYILFFGRISEYKGIKVLLESMKYLNKNNYNFQLVIAGSGEFHFDLNEYSDVKNVHILNRYISMEELNFLIENSKLVVCPYLEATQSGVIMTAFAKEKPVIATNVGGLSEMIENNETGIVIKPNNIEELSNAIISLYKDKQFYSKLCENIAESKKYGKMSWSKIADQYLKL